MAAVGSVLFAVGGYDGSTDLATGESCYPRFKRYDHIITTGESYNPLHNKWSPIPPMGTKRSCLGVAALDGLLYSCGGYARASCLFCI